MSLNSCYFTAVNALHRFVTNAIVLLYFFSNFISHNIRCVFLHVQNTLSTTLSQEEITKNKTDRDIGDKAPFDKVPLEIRRQKTKHLVT
jgi:hypothetical protein